MVGLKVVVPLLSHWCKECKVGAQVETEELLHPELQSNWMELMKPLVYDYKKD